MKIIKRISLIAVLVISFVIATQAQNASPEVLLSVGGEVATPLKLTRADLDKFTRHTVRAKDHDGKDYNYDGVAVIDILQKAGVKFGDALRGKALATYLLVEASDGYQAVYALPEFDPPANDRTILRSRPPDARPAQYFSRFPA